MAKKVPINYLEIISALAFSADQQRVIGIHCGYESLLRLKKAIDLILTSESNREIVEGLIDHQGNNLQLKIELKNWEQ